MKGKPILVLDFDGVIHSYASGWKGAGRIPDPPVPGALEFIVGALDRFDVHILSSRSHQIGGRGAMKKWLYRWLCVEGDVPGSGEETKVIPDYWMNFVAKHNAHEPWPNEVRNAAKRVVRSVKWPTRKPAALYTIDDRAHQFDGSWPTLGAIAGFKPWNKRVAARRNDEGTKTVSPVTGDAERERIRSSYSRISTPNSSAVVHPASEDN